MRGEGGNNPEIVDAIRHLGVKEKNMNKHHNKKT